MLNFSSNPIKREVNYCTVSHVVKIIDRGLHSTAVGEHLKQSQPQITKASSYSLRQLV